MLYALQEGRGRDYEPVQQQLSRGRDLAFDCPVGVKRNASGAVTFTGPFVQGPPRERFIYLDIGAFAGQTDSCWSRRLKIPLTTITWADVTATAVLEARVPGTGRDGGPACATVKSFAGWKPLRPRTV